jgi:Xaa-Pro aminopeptidase
MKTRVDKLRAKMSELGVDAFVVTTPENRRYLSGFTGSAGTLFITQQRQIIVTDFRYVEQSAQQSPDFHLVQLKRGVSWLPDVLKETGAKKLAYEAENLTMASFDRWRKMLQEAKVDSEITWQSTADVVDQVRAVKDVGELKLIARACEISDLAFETVAPTIEPGETESSIAWRLEKVMRESGAEALSFDTIVASGPNAALPHHRAGERQVREGEPIVIDFGARYEGYCADMTRTICVGRPTDQFRQIYDIVLGAQLTVTATLKAGMTGADADKIARDIIEKAGHGDKFGHSLGHGIGLAVHEFPRVGPGANDILVDNMPFTNEPGIYIPGWGGVRIEDTMVMENGRPKALSRAHKYDTVR